MAQKITTQFLGPPAAPPTTVIITVENKSVKFARFTYTVLNLLKLVTVILGVLLSFLHRERLLHTFASYERTIMSTILQRSSGEAAAHYQHNHSNKNDSHYILGYDKLL